jgi:hypothetical protein
MAQMAKDMCEIDDIDDKFAKDDITENRFSLLTWRSSKFYRTLFPPPILRGKSATAVRVAVAANSL